MAKADDEYAKLLEGTKDLKQERKDLAERVEVLDKQLAKATKFTRAVANRDKRKFVVDWGGGSAAQVTTEMINWALRAIARRSPDSWFGSNIDLWQSIPHILAGVAVYALELVFRDSDEVPSGAREFLSKFAEIFSNLGMANLTRALRMRINDAGRSRKATQAELKAAKAEVEALRAQVGDKGNTETEE